MRKVLYVSPNGYLGGAERFVLDAVAGHGKYGNYNASILFFSEGEATKLASERNLQYRVLPFSFRLSKPLSFIRAIFYIRSLLKREKPDVIHSTMPYSHIVMFFASSFMKIRRVWFQHGPVGGRLDKIASYLPCDVILFNSTYLQIEHNHHDNYSSRRVQKIIKLGIGSDMVVADKAENIRKDILGDECKLIVGMLGRVCSWKGFDTFLNSILLLEKSLDEKSFLSCRFLIIGDAHMPDDRHYLELLKKFVVDHGLTENIWFLGHVGDVANYYQIMDVLIHASKIPEPFGLVVAESMLAGTLVVGSDQGGVADILKDGETGLVYQATSSHAAEQLAEILKKVVEDKLADVSGDYYDQLVGNARALIQNDYSIKRMINSLEDLY